MRRSLHISIGFIIIVGLYLLLPFFFGLATQHYFTRFVKNENDTLGKVLDLRFDLTNYNVGWFTSHATLEIEKKTADGHDEIIRTLPLLIKHGPVYRVNGRLIPGLAVIQMKSLPLDQDAYSGSFLGNINFDGSHSAFVLVNNQKNNQSIGGLQFASLAFSMNANQKATRFSFGVEGDNVRYQDQQGVTASVGHLQSILDANYIGARHWQLGLSFNLQNNQAAFLLPGDTTQTIAKADQIRVDHLHMDTQDAATWLSEMIKLKQSSDGQGVQQPTAWMALFQQLLTQLINKDTGFEVKNVTVNSPEGQLELHYSATFPTLNDHHDYFDIATRSVGSLGLAIPSWNYQNSKTGAAITLTGLRYNNDENTLFSRGSRATLNSFVWNDNKTGTPQLVFSLSGLSYDSTMGGDNIHLSQTVSWQLAKACVASGCFDQIQTQLKFANMNYSAFRGIAAATQRVVQFNPKDKNDVAARITDLKNAYAKLIDQNTTMSLSCDAKTQAGALQLKGNLAWPSIISNETFDDLMSGAKYEVVFAFPSVYADRFLNQQTAAPQTSVVQNGAASTATSNQPPMEKQLAEFLQYAISQGYLKKIGDAYSVDLTGMGSKIELNGKAWKAP